MNNLINILKEQKSIPLDRYINIVLYNKTAGYYMKKNPFGKEGDFITSPLISNLFGEMLAVWCIAFWEHLKKPKKIKIVELGPGDGSLCNNLLKTFKNFNNFFECLEINLLEISDKLKLIQKTNIKNKKVKWIKDINEINNDPVIFICNEFFDALPIIQLRKKRGVFFEKFVTCSKNKYHLKTSYKKAKKSLVKKIKNLNLDCSNNIIEYPIKAIEYLNIVSKKIKKNGGGLLIFDYGYINQNNQSTLQSVKKHNYTNILNSPGQADITYQINFKLFKKILEKNNLNIEKIVPQNEFLQKMGILKRAEILAKKMSFKDKANMFYRLKRLLDYKEMGMLYKTMCAQKKGNKFSLGF